MKARLLKGVAERAPACRLPLPPTNPESIFMVISRPFGVAALLFTLAAQLGYEICGNWRGIAAVVLLALAPSIRDLSFVRSALGKMKPMDFSGQRRSHGNGFQPLPAMPRFPLH
jgi:hypothetical protein